jgi:haloalkane dehalogenase
MKLKNESAWLAKIGHQRDWIWQGWHIHYSFSQPTSPLKQQNNIPIILLHGFGVSLKHWRHNIALLSQHHSVYALDLLGFGNSQKAYTNYGVELWSELVYDFWSNFINQPCILIGNSIGSLIALNTVVQYPQMAKGLIMLSLPDVAARQKLIPAKLQSLVETVEQVVANPLLIRLLFYVARKPTIIRRSLITAYINHQHVDDELIHLIIQPTHDRGAARALIALTKSMGKFYTSVSDLLQKVKIPMLLIWGKCDRLVPPNQAQKWAKINPLIQLELLENTGHCPHDEVPEIFHSLTKEWLSINFYRAENNS